jgi:hypothetical protein
MFVVGDKVRVNSTQLPHQNGLIGTIGKLRDKTPWVYLVYFDWPQDHDYLNSRPTVQNQVYREQDLELLHARMQPPEFDLEDIELAEMLIEEMK